MNNVSKIFGVICFSFFFMTHAFAQKSIDNIMSKVMNAKDKQLEGLGLLVLSNEDNKTVLLSKTGRYVIKGTVTDMWDGLQFSDVRKQRYPNVPDLLDLKDFVIEFGDPSLPEVLSYISYSCLLCERVIERVMSSQFLSKHHVKMFLLYNNVDDMFINNNVFCASNRKEEFKSIFLKRDITKLSKKCVSIQSKMNVGLANAQHIKALPSTFVEHKNVVYLGVLPEGI